MTASICPSSLELCFLASAASGVLSELILASEEEEEATPALTATYSVDSRASVDIDFSSLTLMLFSSSSERWG